MVHLEVWLGHGMPGKTVLKNVTRTFNAMLTNFVFYPHSNGEPQTYLKQSRNLFILYHFGGRGEKRLEKG